MHCRIYQVLIILWMSLLPIYLAAEEENKPDKERALCKDVKEEFSETHHEVIINGQIVKYKACAGNLLLKDDDCNSKASLFFVSYTKEGVEDPSQRPITFCFNGGPGSSSIWLHLGVFGPRRVYLTEHGDALPPYHLVDNEFSILDVTDLVFIDPVSTGYSRAIPVDEAKHFYNMDEDVKSIAEFIRLYVTRFNRWGSPKFLAGESYGTTRAASLAVYLHDQNYLYINGIILVSSILNFQSVDFAEGNDLAYILFLPTYTATAWYHQKLAPDLQANFQSTLQEAKDFAMNEYSLALLKGDTLRVEDRKRIIEKMAFYTGLSQDYIDKNNLRVGMFRFVKELLRDQKRTIGRFDSRFKGIDADVLGEYFEYDPSADAIFGAFTATLNQYIHTELKWVKDTHYKVLTNVHPWDYGCKNQYLNVGDSLRGVMTKNPHIRVFVASGYYDLATPFFATDYTFNHLNLDPSLMNHVMIHYYDAGHMMYIHRPSLIKMKKDLLDYYLYTLNRQENEEKEASQAIQR